MEFTHTGQVTSCRLKLDGAWQLRETPEFWVSQAGFKFRKADGTEQDNWSALALDLTTVQITP